MRYQPFSKRLKIKIAALVVIVIACMVGTGLLLSGVQNSLSLSGYTDEMRQQSESLKAALKQADKETQNTKDSFDETFQAKAASMAYLAQHNTGFEATDTKMAEYKQLFGVDNVFVVDRDGQIVAKSGDTKANFSYSRYNRLRSVFTDDKPAAAVEITLPDQDWNERYYSAKLDDTTMGVLEVNPERMDNLVEDNSSLKATLKDITVGQDGYVMAVSAQDYTVQYHPNNKLVGTDALSEGLNVEDLENGKFFHMTFDGTRLYSGVTKIDRMYYIASVPEKALNVSRNITVGVILFAFAVVMAAVVLYGVFVMREDERRGHEAEDERPMGAVLYNKKIGSKATVLSVIGLVVVIVVSFYMQTLFALSSESMVNADRSASIAQTMASTTKRADALQKEFNTRYLNKSKIAAYAIDQNPDLKNKQDLTALAQDLKVDMISVFDVTGKRVASTDPSPLFTLGQDVKTQSGAFRRLLQGSKSLVQKPQHDESTGQMRQYIGVPTYDDEGLVNGLVQIAVRPQMYEDLMKAVDIDNVLEGVQVGNDGFAFAINKKTGKMAYFPDEFVQGKKATKVGLKENQIKGGFSDYLTIDGTKYYASSVETTDYYLYVTGGDSELMAERPALTGVTAGVAAVCLVLIYLVLVFDRRKVLADIKANDEAALRAELVDDGSDDGDSGSVDGAGNGHPTSPRPTSPASAGSPAASEADKANREKVKSGKTANFEIHRPGSDRTMRTQSAASRWMDQAFDWGGKTPEGKLATVIKWAFGLFALLVFFAVMFQEQIFGTQSVFAYILGGGWNKGLNIFAVTGALMSACVIIVIAEVIQWVLRLIGRVTGSRGETMIRLLCSVIKYGTVIGVLYYSLSLLGVDTATLLASAGLLTLAIGFGAQQLVADILSGLFIIFEGEFRVGDVIQVGTASGTVLEIGVRTTKIDDGSGNILVLRNSQVTNVTNKTKLDSFASVDFDIPVGENLPYVENLLAKELPVVAERQPKILDGPFYKGVVNLTSANMTLRVVARCAETDRGAVERVLKREMRLILTRNNIAPYQLQHEHSRDVELSYRDKIKAADELRSADRFLENQLEAAEDAGQTGPVEPSK